MILPVPGLISRVGTADDPAEIVKSWRHKLQKVGRRSLR